MRLIGLAVVLAVSLVLADECCPEELAALVEHTYWMT